MNIKRIIQESVKETLNEMFSSNLYHYTDERSLLDILKFNRIRLTKNGKYHTNNVQNDQRVNQGYPFYLSFTRIKSNTSGYGSWRFNNGICIVRIEFNGDLLNQRYKGQPVDYFMGKNKFYTDKAHDARLVQSEDRLLSKNPYLENVDKYIKEIDIYVPDSNFGYVRRWLYGFLNSETVMHSPSANKIKIFTNIENFNQ